jgi:hypothetical protein
MIKEIYELWCLLEHDLNLIKISIAANKDIYDLKELICRGYGQALQQYSAVYLTLTKVRHSM